MILRNPRILILIYSFYSLLEPTKKNFLNYMICPTRFLAGVPRTCLRTDRPPVTGWSIQLMVIGSLILASPYSDIITGDFTDTYNNLPLKTFAAYQYFLDFCPQASNLIMHDDDMVPRLDKIQNLVEKPIACLNGKPIRDLENSQDSFFHRIPPII